MSNKLINAIFIACIILGLMLWIIDKPSPVTLQGVVESSRVDISTRVQGRVSAYYFDVGDKVKTGQKLLELSNPALQAQLATASAQLAVANASRKDVYSTRPEMIEAQKANLQRAETDVVLAKQTYDRINTLYGRGIVSKQDFDQASSKYKSALTVKESAQATLDLAINGNSPEAKSLADAQAQQVKASYNQTVADMDELTVVAPISGEITARVAELGQLYNPGTPLYSIINIDNSWFTFNVREDLLGGLAVGDEFDVIIPALNNEKVRVRVTLLNILGKYANWRATKAIGDFDLRTFEMRVKPVNPVNNLRVGMSVYAEWDSPVKKEIEPEQVSNTEPNSDV